MPVKYKDYYEILGVPRSANEAEIKRAFRKLAREYHPDVAKNKKHAEERFKEINEAYEVLGDPARRRKYDELGPGWSSGADFRPPPGWHSAPGGRGSDRTRGRPGEEFDFQFGGTGFSDFFEQFFGGLGGRGARFGTSSPFEETTGTKERGRDVQGDIMVTLEEAMRGSVRSVSVRYGVPCDACRGSGVRGRKSCPDCGGTGQTARTETYQVKIPAGIGDGQRLRVPGRGEPGPGGGSAGDLFLRVRFAKHPDYEVEGHHLLYEARLAPWEAVLGAEIQVPTLTGPVSIRIPAGTQSGQKLRLRKRGLPNREGGAGDLIVLAQIEVPGHVSEAERLLWEQLARESRFQPRQ